MNLKKPKRLSRSVIYESAWVNLYADKVEFPAGRIIDRHHIIDFHHGAVAAIVENDEREILFVHAYRYPLDSIEWEVPTGGMDEGESPLESAHREVLEESGWETSDHQMMYSFNPINGISDLCHHVVRCRATECNGTFDKNEIESVKWVPMDEVKRMIAGKEINDGFTLTALLLFLNEQLKQARKDL
ncbi:MAG: NUDIX hydrolase [Candidatus Electryoneaceae bacterium]|nr:NUDIX hydrolase [Candidatus Electryoneaceae bacterium]